MARGELTLRAGEWPGTPESFVGALVKPESLGKKSLQFLFVAQEKGSQLGPGFGPPFFCPPPQFPPIPNSGCEKVGEYMLRVLKEMPLLLD